VKWKEYCVLCEKDAVDLVAAVFHDLGSSGVIIEESQYVRNNLGREAWAIKSIPSDYDGWDFYMVKAYFAEEQEIMSKLEPHLRRLEEERGFNCHLLEVEIQEEDWQNSWRKYFHTTKIGSKLIIKPSWEEYEAGDSEVIVNIDPGMAFGTGLHSSTRFCLQLLEKYLQGGERVLDAGCGSGILAIAAAQLGAQSVVAVDLDDLAVSVARENIIINDLDDRIKVVEANALEVMSEQPADIILANLTADILTFFIPVAARTVVAGTLLIVAGILKSRWPEIKALLEKYNFSLEDLLEDDEWCGAAAIKK
jgi:ribosomal protein L11 methyltransferase